MKIQVLVKPNAREEKVEKVDASTFRISVKARPVDGKANEAVVAVLAKYFFVPKRNVEIVTGTRGKTKIVEITPR
jgi:uncharacterized protein (TIGR00251 family)